MFGLMPKRYLRKLAFSLVGLAALTAFIGSVSSMVAGLLAEEETVQAIAQSTAEETASAVALWRTAQQQKATLVAAYVNAAVRCPQSESPGQSNLMETVAQALPAGTGILVRDEDDRVVHRRLSRGTQNSYRWDITCSLAPNQRGWHSLTLRIPTERLTEITSALVTSADAVDGRQIGILDLAVNPPVPVAGTYSTTERPTTGFSEQTGIDGTTHICYATSIVPDTVESAGTQAATSSDNWVLVLTLPKSEAYHDMIWIHSAAGIGVILGILAAIGLVPFLLRRLSKTCAEIETGVTAITSGDYSHRIACTGKDELEALCRSINSILKALDSSTGKINEDIEALTSSAMAILSASEQQQAAATQQSTSLQQTVSTVEELDLSARQAADNAQEVVSRTEEASQQILDLSEKAQRINKVSEFIDQISRQIRVLALNASIEASQVTESSSGFNVIASEIHRLAEDTRKSTTEIEDLVQDMQDATNSSVMTMEQMVESVKVIGMAMNQQSVATGQISEAMTDMNRSMSQSLESTESTVRQSDEINALARSLEEAMANLQAMKLDSETDQAQNEDTAVETGQTEQTLPGDLG